VSVPSFSWSDATEVVKVYFDVPGFGDVPADAVTVASTGRSFEARVAAGGAVHVLKKAGLHADITGATAKKGKTKIIVTLTKKDPVSWWELTAGGGAGYAGDD
jgi:hypothetical protein